MATVAIWVLSPISARKKVIRVAPNTPRRLAMLVSSSSILSGIMVQMAMPRKDKPSTQRSTSGLKVVVIQVPRAPARPWLSTVATRMPRMMGSGFLKRAARMKASNWVLSPISARATTPVETRRDSIQVVSKKQPDIVAGRWSAGASAGAAGQLGIGRVQAPAALAGQLQDLLVKGPHGLMVADADGRDRQALQLAIQQGFIGPVQRAGGLVQQEVARLGQQRAGKGQALLLTGRQDLAPVQLGLQPPEAPRQIGQVHGAQPFVQLRVGDVALGVRVEQLGAQVPQGQIRVLGQKEHVRPRRAQHLAGTGVPQAG